MYLFTDAPEKTRAACLPMERVIAFVRVDQRLGERARSRRPPKRDDLTRQEEKGGACSSRLASRNGDSTRRGVSAEIFEMRETGMTAPKSGAGTGCS